jgi:hypothetical protein
MPAMLSMPRKCSSDEAPHRWRRGFANCRIDVVDPWHG